MLFCTLPYLYFFCVVFTVYWALPWPRARVWLLLGASYYFYASWSSTLAMLVAGTSLMDYFIGRSLDMVSSQRLRRALLGMSLVVNLGVLAYFKYANFFLQSLEAAVNSAGGHASIPLLKLLAPIGISFYTFEAINYTVDVFRRRVKAETSLPNFMVFILFFPHLVAGPIVRARDFLPQIRRRKHWDWARLQIGAQLFLMGMFKKMAIADHMAQFADPVFADPTKYGSWAVWLAVVAYTVQIYCDFSGYTDMALGTAHMLGYHLSMNFNMPYLARSVSEFWHRWHISLSTWLRDYLYIPLGGSIRGSPNRTRLNLLLTMTLGGLWHGASGTYILWGVFHGLMLIGHRVFEGFCQVRPRLSAVLRSWPGTVCCWGVTLLCVMVGWVLFRASAVDLEMQNPEALAAETVAAAKTVAAAAISPAAPIESHPTSMQIARAVFKRMLIWQHGHEPPLPSISLWCLLGVMAVAHIMGHYHLWDWLSVRLPAPALGFGYATVLTLALLLAPASSKAFIYFQF